MIKVRIPEVGLTQAGRAEPGVPQRGPFQASAVKVRARSVGMVEVGAPQITAIEPRPAQVGAPQRPAGQIGMAQIGLTALLPYALQPQAVSGQHGVECFGRRPYSLRRRGFMPGRNAETLRHDVVLSAGVVGTRMHLPEGAR
nr:hypothetical protein [Azospirillum argentinense]